MPVRYLVSVAGIKDCKGITFIVLINVLIIKYLNYK